MDSQEEGEKNQQMASIYHLNGKYLAYVVLENSTNCTAHIAIVHPKLFAHIRPENH